MGKWGCDIPPIDEGGESSSLGPPGGLLLSALRGLPVSHSDSALPDPSFPLVIEPGVALLTFEFSSGAVGDFDLPFEGGSDEGS